MLLNKLRTYCSGNYNNIYFWLSRRKDSNIYDFGFKQKTMEGNPQTFISTVGLYNASDELVAIGRLSTPVQKNHSTEAVIKVKLVY